MTHSNLFKIGEKVAYKGTNAFLGYVSHVHQGHLFLLDDFDITVHIGNGIQINVKDSELQRFKEEGQEHAEQK